MFGSGSYTKAFSHFLLAFAFWRFWCRFFTQFLAIIQLLYYFLYIQKLFSRFFVIFIVEYNPLSDFDELKNKRLSPKKFHFFRQKIELIVPALMLRATWPAISTNNLKFLGTLGDYVLREIHWCMKNLTILFLQNFVITIFHNHNTYSKHFLLSKGIWWNTFDFPPLFRKTFRDYID